MSRYWGRTLISTVDPRNQFGELWKTTRSDWDDRGIPISAGFNRDRKGSWRNTVSGNDPNSFIHLINVNEK
ncbi:uncharacterized protein ARMOST_08098 [Armillaria ostoyae]|uniref:Uncharacterized protein n=1 Tax=Armillaria ostoyae TaxID=47428 RepID=A0A284R7M5_ARMOS|nr:uncharacterized protein ARMOST_08098 [Armillaria ostoyae]